MVAQRSGVSPSVSPEAGCGSSSWSGTTLSLIDAARRSLRRRIVGPHRLDGVTDELETNRLARAGGKKSTTPPRTENSPGSSVGSWRRVPGLDQAIPEVYRRNIVAGSDRQPCFLKRGGGVSRGSSAGADATIRRATPGSRRATPGREPRPRRSAEPGLDTGRSRGTGTAAPCGRPRRPTRLRARRRRNARPR